MNNKVLHKRTVVKDRIPSPDIMDYGEIFVNYNAESPTLTFKKSDNTVAEVIPFKNSGAISAVTVNGVDAVISNKKATVTIDGGDINIGENIKYDSEDIISSGSSISSAFTILVEKIVEDEETVAAGFDSLNDSIEAKSTFFIETTYADLVDLVASSGLKKGATYRITDYACTTTQEDTQSAGHNFDILVVADDESTLNENARAIQHSGDTYFANCDLSAWELKYSLDNDTDRFTWADSGSTGRGVIYYMKDEYNNKCPYDFKNIQFKRYKITEVKAYYKNASGQSGWYNISGVTGSDSDLLGGYGLGTNSISVNEDDMIWSYTFAGYDEDNSTTEDLTIWQASNTDDGIHCFNNVILPSTNSDYESTDKFYLNNICIIDDDGCGDAMKNNHFGGDCSDNTVWGYYFSDNIFGNYCYCNTFGNYCYYNTFGNDCWYNTFGNYCNNNTFGNDCDSNTFGNDCDGNTFGNYFQYNTFGNDCYRNTFGNSCGGNTFGNSCGSNTFGNYCYYNTFGNDCYSNTFGNSFRYNTFGNECDYNTFGNGVNYCGFYATGASTPKDYVYYCTINEGVSHCRFVYSTSTASNAKLQNIKVHSGLNYTSDTVISITNVTTNAAYSWEIANDPTGVLRQFCIASLV